VKYRAGLAPISDRIAAAATGPIPEIVISSSRSRAPRRDRRYSNGVRGTRQVMRARLCHRLPADVEAPATARRLLHDWLVAWSWQAEEAVDVVLAVNEVVSNAVQHAAATRVTVEAPTRRWMRAARAAAGGGTTSPMCGW
jgi:hypothetical protein